MSVATWAGTVWPVLYLAGGTAAVGLAALVGSYLERRDRSEKLHGPG